MIENIFELLSEMERSIQRSSLKTISENTLAHQVLLLSQALRITLPAMVGLANLEGSEEAHRFLASTYQEVEEVFVGGLGEK